VLRTGPLVSVILTGPVAVALAALAYTGTDPLFALPGTADAVRQTINVVVLPAMVVVVPLGLFYEAERLRRRRIVKAFPDTLNILASANQMGISLTEALDLVARWSEGVIARELRKVRNDIRWNNDVEQALLAMGARLEVPRVMRTTKLIAKGSQSTSDLSRVLGIAAEETRSRHRLERQRRQEMNAYIAIVVIGFLVYLGVVVMVHHSFLQPIAELGEQASDLEAGGPLPDVGDLPVETYQMVFFHSALIQGVGSGLLAGKLAENELLAGLKYGVALVTITVAVFLLL
jgi:flagellar protein FlaJ